MMLIKFKFAVTSLKGRNTMDRNNVGGDNGEFSSWDQPERELNQWDAVNNPDLLEFRESGGVAHPTPEQLLMKLAIEKVLMRDQKKLWELYNYSGLNQTEIAKKLRVTPQAVTKRIKVIEKLLTKFCLEHKEAIDTLNEASDDGC